MTRRLTKEDIGVNLGLLDPYLILTAILPFWGCNMNWCPSNALQRWALLLPLFASLGVHAVAHTCVEPSPDIVAWWPFDETSGTVSHDIIGANEGQHIHGPVAGPGRVDGALRFDGVDDYVVVGDSDLWAFGMRDFTIEFWAKFDMPASGSLDQPGDVFISSDEGMFDQRKWFFALNSTHLAFHVNSPGTGPIISPQTPFAPLPNTWYHIAITRNGTDYRIYVDGVFSGAGTNVAETPDPDALLTIGRAQEPFAGYMNGSLDEMSVYHRALTETDILAIVESGEAGKCKGALQSNFPIAIRGGANSTELVFVQTSTTTLQQSVSAVPTTILQDSASAVFRSPQGEVRDAGAVDLAPNSTASIIFTGGVAFEVGHVEATAGRGVVVTQIINLSIPGIGEVPPIGIAPSRSCRRPVAVLKRNLKFDTGVALSNTAEQTATCSWSIHSGKEGAFVGNGTTTVLGLGQTQYFPLNSPGLQTLSLPFEGNIQYECDIAVHSFSLFQRKEDGTIFSSATGCK